MGASKRRVDEKEEVWEGEASAEPGSVLGTLPHAPRFVVTPNAQTTRAC